MFDVSKIVSEVDKLITKHAKPKLPHRVEIVSSLLASAVSGRSVLVETADIRNAFEIADEILDYHKKTVCEEER